MLKSIVVFTAACIASASAIVWDAKIIEPNNSTVLTAGQTFTVRWNTTVDGYNIPSTATGDIFLGYRTSNQPEDEHLDWKLGKNFDLSTGSYEVTIPKHLKTRNDYILSLLGDTGNISPYFTINAAPASEDAEDADQSDN